MYQETQKEKINRIGILAGLFLSFIPFYYFIRILKSIRLIKKEKGLAITSLVVSFFTFLSCSISAIMVLKVIIENPFLLLSQLDYMYSYAETPSMIAYSDGFILSLVGSIIISVFLCIPDFILQIIVGFQLKKGLEDTTYDEVSDEERYEVAKVAGVFLAFVPLYIIICAISDLDILKRIQVKTNVTGLLITFIILFFVGMASGLITLVIPYANYIIFIIRCIVGIIIGNKLNRVFSDIREQADVLTNEKQVSDHQSQIYGSLNE